MIDHSIFIITGITSKLEHFIESGVGAIWLSPINRSPMIDFGYDISDFKDIDKIFGTIEDFKDLMARAKKLGLKVVESKTCLFKKTLLFSCAFLPSDNNILLFHVNNISY